MGYERKSAIVAGVEKAMDDHMEGRREMTNDEKRAVIVAEASRIRDETLGMAGNYIVADTFYYVTEHVCDLMSRDEVDAGAAADALTSAIAHAVLMSLVNEVNDLRKDG